MTMPSGQSHPAHFADHWHLGLPLSLLVVVVGSPLIAPLIALVRPLR
jgi:hypothetical protein